MITVTPRAAEQIRANAHENRLEGIPLRIAAKRLEDGGIHYGMGFDDQGREEDTVFRSEGIELVIAPVSIDLLSGTVLDYVEMEPGEFRFIFLNPNDPNFSPPQEDAAS
ncbi:iron-sulfur cluster assembly accessory protein [Ectothiorhodospiraceae bacterium 2226]|nr:iron-sulfur cluster assembly accessory protein [Ectothiorhodospiraceae bacterium 2226]